MKKFLLVLFLFAPLAFVRAEEKPLYTTDFSGAALGKLPAGWRDLGISRASPNWGVDGKGFLRVLWKGELGLAVYDGVTLDGRTGKEFLDGILTARFQKTPDADVYFGLAGRVQDARNFYVLRFSGAYRLELFKVANGKEESLAQWVTRSRYQEVEEWSLLLAFDGARITGRVLDAKGIEQARVDALEKEEIHSGGVGLQCTNFAAARSFTIGSLKPFAPALSNEQIDQKNTVGAADRNNYLVLRPVAKCEELNTSFSKLSDAYDVVVAGAGTGGWAGAVQAVRLGAKVLLLEESDWIGGQMAAAAVTSMDEEGMWGKVPVRERGIYKEFNESMVNYYYTLNKDPFRAYYAWPEQLEGGYEPKIARAMLYAFIAETRKTGVLDLAVETKVIGVVKQGQVVHGVVAENNGVKKTIQCKVLVEATEYGDVLPLAGARYRVGNVTSDKLDPQALVQSHTWVGVIREYPEGVPDNLGIKTPPPGYDSKKYRGSQLWGPIIWGSAGKDVKGPRSYRVIFAWRGMADSDSPMTGRSTEQRHTQCGLNGGRQDYPVTVASIEDPVARRAGERDGIYRTLSEIYYFQNELGLPWAVANDEGYNTPLQQLTMGKLDLRPDLLPIAVYLPQWPYVREARRAVGLYTLRAADLERFEKARLFPTAIAMGDYFMDLDHGGTGAAIEKDLDSGQAPRGGGPFQVPFEVFIPEKVDGLVLAEKNLSQSRLVNGATRLQPITMLTGQAAGTIAALAALKGVQPRQVNPIAVQSALLASGSNLIQRWHEDVKWGTPLWQGTQLLALYSVFDPPGPFVKGPDLSMGGGQFWNVDAPVTVQDFSNAVARLGELAGKKVSAPSPGNEPLTWAKAGQSLAGIDPVWKKRVKGLEMSGSSPVKRGDLALVAAEILRATGKPVLLGNTP